MAIDWFLKTSTAVEPKPNATQQGTDAVDFETYATSFDALLNANTGTATTRSRTYVSVNDGLPHFSESMGWITPPLAAGTSSTGAWSAKIWCSTNAIPPPGANLYLKAALFEWNDGDTSGGQIGTTQITGIVTTTITAHTLTFSASSNRTFNAGDRIYLSVWAYLDFDIDPSGAIYTPRVNYFSSLRDSKITTPDGISLNELLQDPIMSPGLISFPR